MGEAGVPSGAARAIPMRLLRLIFWLLTAAYWVTLCVLTHLPPRDVPQVQVDDKLQHFLSYGLLAGMTTMAVWVTFPRRRWLVWAVLGVGLVYGAIDEQTQTLVGRTCELGDWIADAAGTVAGVLPVVILQRLVSVPPRRRRETRVRTIAEEFAPELEAALAGLGGGPSRDRRAARGMQ
jgi:VanZ family protein